MSGDCDPDKYFYNCKSPPFSENLYEELRNRCPYVFLICFRTKNKNVVIFQARVKNDKLLNPPVVGYWLLLEPGYSKNNEYDREELSFADNAFAYGFHSQWLNDYEAIFEFNNFNQKIHIKLSDKGLFAFAHRNNRKYLLRSLFIDASENLHLLKLSDNVKSISVSCLDITSQPYQPARIFIKGGASASCHSTGS